MPRKLGEILVAGQSLAPADLKRALDAQLIFGGRLGTNLLELGFLDEEQVATALREQTRVQVASEEMLEKASPEALRLIPAKVAARHVVVPLELRDKKLHVAMVDPTDLIVLDELAFVTGCQVVPLVAPEVRLFTYLERYYDISRPLRYIKLSDAKAPPSAELDDRALAAQFTDGQLDLGSEGGAPPPSSATSRQRPRQAEEVSPEGEQVLSISELLGVEGGDEKGEALTPEALKRADGGTEEQRAKMDAALEKLKEQRQQAALEEAEQEREAVGTLEDAARLLAEAETREDIGEALVRYACNMFPRVMTFIVQKDRALGWLGHFPGQTREQARQAARRVLVPLGEPSVLQGVAASGQYYMGELPARAGDQAIAAALGTPRPANLVIMPIKLNEKTVILLHGDNLDQPLSGFDMRSLRAACQKASLAMEVLLLRSKIRQVSG